MPVQHFGRCPRVCVCACAYVCFRGLMGSVEKSFVVDSLPLFLAFKQSQTENYNYEEPLGKGQHWREVEELLRSYFAPVVAKGGGGSCVLIDLGIIFFIAIDRKKLKKGMPFSLTNACLKYRFSTLFAIKTFVPS